MTHLVCTRFLVQNRVPEDRSARLALAPRKQYASGGSGSNTDRVFSGGDARSPARGSAIRARSISKKLRALQAVLVVGTVTPPPPPPLLCRYRINITFSRSRSIPKFAWIVIRLGLTVRRGSRAVIRPSSIGEHWPLATGRAPRLSKFQFGTASIDILHARGSKPIHPKDWQSRLALANFAT